LAESSHTERFPPGIETYTTGYTEATRAVAIPSDSHRALKLSSLPCRPKVECIKYIREHPEPDGVKIYDIPIYPAMFRSMKCDGYAITFRMQNREVQLYAIVLDG
jgi:hypothetical protein